MAEKEPGLHKNIASIFQGFSVHKKQQQKESEHDESKQTDDVISELLTPSHLVSKTKESAAQEDVQTTESTEEIEEQIVYEQTEEVPEIEASEESVEEVSESMQEISDSVERATDSIEDVPDTEHMEEAEQAEAEQQTVQAGAPETSESLQQRLVQEQPDTVEETVKPEETPAKVAPAKPVVKRSGIQKVLITLQEKLLAPKPGVDPKRQKIMLILIPVLVIALIAVLPQVFKKPARNINTGKETGSSAAVMKTSGEIEWQRPPLYPENLRDPMQFGSVATVKTTYDDIVVKGILYSQDNPSALIAEQIVHEGDEVFGAVIIKINRDSVEFERDGQTWTQKVQR